MSKYLREFVICALLFVLFLQRECTTIRQDSPQVTIISHTDTLVRYDTIREVIPQYIPEVYTLTDTVVIWADTGAILADYNRRVVYRDTVKDSAYRIVLRDVVQFNRLGRRAWDIEIYNRTNYIHTIDSVIVMERKRNQWYASMQVMVAGNALSANMGIDLITKRQNLYRVGYDPFNRAVMVGMGWRLR
jgi:hypothetical protein